MISFAFARVVAAIQIYGIAELDACANVVPLVDGARLSPACGVGGIQNKGLECIIRTYLVEDVVKASSTGGLARETQIRVSPEGGRARRGTPH